MHIGEQLRQIRVVKKITGKDVYDNTGIHPGSLSLIENGESNPTTDTIQRLVDYYGESSGAPCEVRIKSIWET